MIETIVAGYVGGALIVSTVVALGLLLLVVTWYGGWPRHHDAMAITVISVGAGFSWPVLTMALITFVIIFFVAALYDALR
jgi:hypothetical protein